MTPPNETPIENPNALPAGTRFGELEILCTLGVGGFGIVYLARDHALERRVAIKEYMPAQLAERGATAAISVRSASMRDTFEVGLRSFVNEARLLARYDHPSLVKVYRFWEANGTAYMAMPYLQGHTLKDVREGLTQPPDEAWILRRILPLLDALEHLHADHVFHRDVAPDNILMLNDTEAPVLLDFGAARHVIGERTHSLTAIFKPSYAAIEQYGETTTLKQGPWTDIYSVGAVMHYLLTGTPPPLATTRAVVDEVMPLAHQETWPEHTVAFRAAIDWALAVRPKERPGSVADLRRALVGECAAPMPRRPELAPPVAEQVSAQAYAPTQVILPVRTQLTQAEPHRNASRAEDQGPAGQTGVTPRAEVARAPGPVRKNGLIWALGGVALLLLAAFWMLLTSRPAAPGGDAAAAPSPVAQAPEVAVAPRAAAASEAALTPPSAAPVTPASAGAASGKASGPIGVNQGESSARVQGQAASAVGPRASQPLPKPKPGPVGGSVLARPEPSAASGDKREPAVASAVSGRSRAVGAALDPREACGDRQLFAFWHCVQNHCERPAYAEHPECKAIEERRAERRERRNR